MLTVITGNPRSGKTLYTVATICRGVPGSVVEDARGRPVVRHLFSNIDGLLVDHQPIDAENLGNWHTWAKPGDVIVFDEVQEVWRPRALGREVPAAIAALETHGHMGVDIVLITQNPMLIDANIRRLVNRHVHVRRLPAGWAYLYEWDHCGEPGKYKTCISSGTWRYPREVFELYKSAELHTKPVTKVPGLIWVAVAGFAVAGYAIPQVYDSIQRKGAPKAGASKPAQSSGVGDLLSGVAPQLHAPGAALAPAGVEPPAVPISAPVADGCARTSTRCECFTADGVRVPTEPEACESRFVGGAALAFDDALGLSRDVPAVPAARPEDGEVIGWMRRRH